MTQRVLAILVFAAALCCCGSADAVIYGPDLSTSSLRSNVSDQFYVLTTEEPDAMDVFTWHYAEPYNGGFDSGIDSAQADSVQPAFPFHEDAAWFRLPPVRQDLR
ncbi:MAG: hypothetical protein U5N86_08050 [Planctomycetota bacterium]|nr:hypothetical protein [Planctomycetota bacterium]